MGIIHLQGNPIAPPTPTPPPEDQKIELTPEEWAAIQQKLRQADLYVITLMTLCRLKGGKLKLSIYELAETERAGRYGLEFEDDSKDMTFKLVDFNDLKKTAN